MDANKSEQERADELEVAIRKAIADGFVLTHDVGYIGRYGTCGCAIGAALAVRYPVMKERLEVIGQIIEGRRTDGHGIGSDTAEMAHDMVNRIVNGLTADDLFNMEAGYEGWYCRNQNSYNRLGGVGGEAEGPFFELGKRLRDLSTDLEWDRQDEERIDWSEGSV